MTRTRVAAKVAHTLLRSSPILGIREYPACVEFRLADGKSVWLYEGDRDNEREWFTEQEGTSA